MLRQGGDGDAEKASAAIGGGPVLLPEQAVAKVMEGLAEDRFLIMTHPEMHEFVVGKAEKPERWIRGMSKLRARAEALLAGG
jgi:hypothetical protein